MINETVAMMVKYKYSLKIVFFSLITLILPACSQDNDAQEQVKTSLYQDTIKIGAVAWPGYLALYIADVKGYFNEAGLNVQLIRYNSLGELSKDYVNGVLLGRANLNIEAINESAQGLKHKAVVIIDYSNGSDGIVANKTIKSIADLKGKKVGYDPGTLEEYILSHALMSYQLSLKDIEPVASNAEDVIDLLKDGSLLAAVTYEPYLTVLINEGYHTIYTSKEAPGLITDILTFRSDFIEQQEETITAIVTAYFRGIDLWRNNPDEAIAILAKEFSVTKTEAEAQLKGVYILNLQENKVAFSFSAGLKSLYGSMRKTAAFFHRNAKENSIDIAVTDQLIEPGFIKSLK